MGDNKITLFINSLGGGGAEKISVSIANAFIQNGFEVQFVVLNLHKQINRKFLDKKIELLNLNIKHTRYSIYAVYKYLKKNSPGKILVFNHEITVILFLLRYFTAKKFKIIARNISNLSEKRNLEKSIWHKYVKENIIKIFYAKIDKIIAQSQGMKEDLINNYGVTPQKIVVINNFIGNEFEDELLKNTSIEKNKNEVLFVGRLEEVKGLFYLLKAFKIVLSQNKHVQLRIVGDGSLLNSLVNYVQQNQMDKNVLFEGYNRNIIDYYKKAQLTVLSSLYEGFPNVLIESIAVGTPIVAFDCNSGPREIIVESINGFLVPYRNIEKLAEIIIKTIQYNWDIDQIKKTAIKYRKERIIKEYIKVIQE